MRETLNLPPPAEYLTYSPSELFRFFFRIGRWTEESFCADFQNYTRGKLISTVTVSKWKNRDVIPTRYSGQLFKMIEDQFEPSAAKDWMTAFETVWATHIAQTGKKPQHPNNRNFSDSVCRQHCAWINAKHAEKVYGESFSASDIYVPLQLIQREKETETLYDVEDLLTLITAEKDTSKQLDWTFICGGPGSGKSMAAIHLAQKMSKTNIFPIYLRGSHLSQIPIDIQNSNQPVIDSFSIKSFLQHFRSSSRKTACLVLDGIDEITGAVTGNLPALNQILADLRLEQNVCRAHGKRLHVIALGRHSHIEFASNMISQKASICLEMLGLDGRYQHRSKDKTFGRDLRAEWWAKYLSAAGYKADTSLPDFLCTDYDDYSDFGSEPLLTYLICSIAFKNRQDIINDALPHETVNALTYKKNRNEIYQDIIKQIHTRTAFQSGHQVEFRDYFSVLQHMAFANWYNGDGRTVSMKKVQDCIQDKDTETAFKALNLKSPDMLITAFYYRITKSEAGNQTVAEFTHKTFSEYLVSTLIFDRFQQLITAFASNKDLNVALKNWTRLARAGAHEPNLADFCQKEAALRFKTFSNLNWDCALTIINKHSSKTMQGIIGLEAISETQRSASLLLFIWSCLNLERQKRTDIQFNLFGEIEQFNALKLKQIQLPNTLDLKTHSIIEPPLQHRSFLTPSLSALHLSTADMSQLNFTMGHIESLRCERVSFAMTHWSHVKISQSIFHKSVFQHSILHGGRLRDTQFSNCLFQAIKIQLTSFIDCSFKNMIFSQCHFADVEFISTQMQGVIFDRCTFANCRFSNIEKPAKKTAAIFRYCSFLDMEKSIETRINHEFEHCIFQDSEDLTKNNLLESQIGELLL